MTDRHDIKDSIAFMTALIAACCGLALAVGCSDATRSDVSGQTQAPLVVPISDWEPPLRTEAYILADRILQREDDGLLLDASARQELAGELGAVLARIRDVFPAVADITPQESYFFGEMSVRLEPPLYEAVVDLLQGQAEPVLLITGYPEFDALNEMLGLSAVDIWFNEWHLEIVTLHFSEYVNVPVAAGLYTELGGVRHGGQEPLGYYDVSHIDAVKSESGWYVIFWRDSDVCGCSKGEIFFFLVNDDDIEWFDHAQAVEIAEFRELLDQYYHLFAPAPCPALWRSNVRLRTNLIMHRRQSCRTRTTGISCGVKPAIWPTASSKENMNAC